MDTSETYIKMSDCPEIQSIRGEVWIAHGSGILYSYDDVYYKCLTDNGNGWHLIWLPRQDRLQEMVSQWRQLDIGGDYSHWLAELLHGFNSFWVSQNMSDKTSMEQLWMAFVMKENHNKVWDGEQWINQ